MWLGLLHNLRELTRLRGRQRRCKRCGLLHEKSLDRCPHCAEFSDQQLANLLGKRKRQRLGFARVMIALSVIIFFLLLYINL